MDKEKNRKQLNFQVDARTKAQFDLMCKMRGWTKEQGLMAMIAFVKDARKNRKPEIDELLKKHRLAKVSE